MESISLNTAQEVDQVRTIQGYYKWHAKIYAATRWTFLFGRKRLIKALKIPVSSKKTIVEVGCGTGHNLVYLAKNYPVLQLTGVDISTDMLEVATQKLKPFQHRIKLLERPYSPGNWILPAKPDIVLFSYCLTMINPGWEDALQRASDDLSEGDHIAMVDFYNTPSKLFRKWMGFNHVRMDEHLLESLNKQFKPVHLEIHQAYGGLWTYLIFVGRK